MPYEWFINLLLSIVLLSVMLFISTVTVITSNVHDILTNNMVIFVFVLLFYSLRKSKLGLITAFCNFCSFPVYKRSANAIVTNKRFCYSD